MDLNKLIEDSGLRFKVVAAALFPNNGHPHYALKRVINEELPLSTDQLVTLSHLTRTPIEQILSDGFKGAVVDGQIELIQAGYKYRLVLPHSKMIVINLGSGTVEAVVDISERLEQSPTVREFLAWISDATKKELT